VPAIALVTFNENNGEDAVVSVGTTLALNAAALLRRRTEDNIIIIVIMVLISFGAKR
jgi:hypothetical protein